MPLFVTSARTKGDAMATASKAIDLESTPWGRIPKYLIHDRDAVYGGDFDHQLASLGIAGVRSRPRAPTANTIAERIVRTIRTECLDHLIVMNARDLSAVLAEFADYYNRHRPHRSLGLHYPVPGSVPARGPVVSLLVSFTCARAPTSPRLPSDSVHCWFDRNVAGDRGPSKPIVSTVSQSACRSAPKPPVLGFVLGAVCIAQASGWLSPQSRTAFRDGYRTPSWGSLLGYAGAYHERITSLNLICRHHPETYSLDKCTERIRMPRHPCGTSDAISNAILYFHSHQPKMTLWMAIPNRTGPLLNSVDEHQRRCVIRRW